MWVTETNISVYYPTARKALRLQDDNPMKMPLFEAFLDVSRYETGLPIMGYQIVASDVRDDTLITTWIPAEHLSRQLGKAKTTYQHDKLSKVAFYAPDGSLVFEVRFEDYHEYGNSVFPLRLLMIRNGETPVHELITFSPPSFDTAKVDSIQNLEIPPGVHIEDLGGD
jgi:hypothetical protein